MPTPNFNLPLYTVGDTAELDVLLNGQSNAMDTALLAAESRTVGTDAQRIALTAPRRKEGLRWYSTDTNREWFYDGTNWITVDDGLYIVQPSSVANGTLNSDGSVTAAGGTSAFCELRGLFSSRFRYYRILFDVVGTVADVTYFRYLQGAVQLAPGSGYVNNGLWVNSAGPAVTPVHSANSFGRISPISSLRCDGEMLVQAPNEATSPSTMVAQGGGGGLLFHSTSGLVTPVAVDGIGISRNAQTIAGTIKAYGYN